MNPILESISNSIAALPAASFMAPPVAGQRGTGGFAATLAAAQGSTAISNLNARAIVNVNLQPRKPLSAAGSSAASSSTTGSTTTGSRTAGSRTASSNLANNVAPVPSVLTASELAWPGSQTSQLPSLIEAGSLQNGGVTGESIPALPALAAPGPGLNQPALNQPANFLAPGSVGEPVGGAATAYAGSVLPSDVLLSDVLLSDQISGQANEQADSLGGASGWASHVSALHQPASSLAPGSAVEPVGGVAKPAATDALVGNARPPVVVPAPAQPQPEAAAISSSSSTAPGNQPNNSEIELGPTEPTAVAENTQPSELSFISTSISISISTSTSTSELPPAGAVWNATADIPGSGAQASGFALGTAQYAAQRFPSAAEPTAGATAPPVLLASALPEAGPLAGAQPSLNANLQIAQDQIAQDQIAQNQVARDQVAQDQVAQELPVQVQSAPENASPAVATSSAPQSNVPPPAEIGNLLSAMAGAPAAAPSVLNSNSQVPALSQPALRPVAGRVIAPALASVRGPSASSVPTSALGTEPAAGNGSPLASQSPFSVFFSSTSSSAGPGTEAAAGALPKMILPAASAASHTGITANSAGTAANSQSSGLQSNAVQPAASQTIASQTIASQTGASQTNKDSLSASASGSSPAGQPLHAESTTATPSVAIAQAATAAPAAALTSAPVAGIAAAQSATVPLPQPGLSPGAGAAGPASPVPAAPQALPTAAPGPVQVAQMVDRMGQSEMRVGMNTSAFGNVEVRTVVHASDVGLTIGSEKGDLRGMLANDMPAITNNLQQQNLRLSSVSFSQGFSFSNQNSGGGDAQQRSFVPAPAAASYGSPEALPADSSEVLSIGEFGGAGNSLSILA